MRAIETKAEHKSITERVEELLKIVTNKTPETDKNFIELNILSDLLADYEETHHPIQPPTLSEVIKHRMYERGINQKKLAEMLEVSTSRISEYVNGKSEPTLKMARAISKKLDIDPNIILGN